MRFVQRVRGPGYRKEQSWQPGAHPQQLPISRNCPFAASEIFRATLSFPSTSPCTLRRGPSGTATDPKVFLPFRFSFLTSPSDHFMHTHTHTHIHTHKPGAEKKITTRHAQTQSQGRLLRSVIPFKTPGRLVNG